MQKADFEALVNDIGVHGLRNNITLFDGAILDGWHRYQACLQADVEPRYQEYKGADPAGYVRSVNWHRRHLTESQRAMAQVALTAWAKRGGNQSAPGADSGQTAAEIAKDAQVGTRTVERAKVVHAKGSDALKTAVIEGDITVKQAAEIAKLPAEKQAEAMAAPAIKPSKSPSAPASIVPLEEYEALKAANVELQELVENQADMLRTHEALSKSDTGIEMDRLREELRLCRRRRDELMANAVELRKTCAFWEKQAKKLGWKPKQ